MTFNKLINRLDPLKTFIILAVFFGSLIIILYPPFTGGDEEAHFLRAQGIANGELVVGGGSTVEAPTSFRKTIGCMQNKVPVSGKMYTYKYEEYGESKRKSIGCALGISPDWQITEKVVTTASGYFPGSYIPQVIGIYISKIINAPIVIAGYLVRFSVLIAYILLISIAIKILPVRKWALVGVGLLPYSMTQVVNPGGDYLLYGAISIFIAIIVKSWYKNHTTSNDNTLLFPLLLLSATIMTLPKGMFPGVLFLPLLFFYKGPKKYIFKKGVILIVILIISFLWQRFGATYLVEDVKSSMPSILTFPKALIKTQFYDWSGHDLFYKGMATHWDSVGMPSVFISITNSLIFVYLMVRYSRTDLNILYSKKIKVIFSIIASLIIVGVIVGSFAAMYIAASSLQVGDYIIRGVQQRYFYPILFLVAIIPSRRWFIAKEKTYKIVVIFGTIISLTGVVAVLLLRFKWGLLG